MKKRKPNFKLSAEEKQWESELEQGQWVPVSAKERRKIHDEMVKMAKTQLKETRVNLRLNPDDVEKIRLKARHEGIPYQTLIGSVLHKCATDQLLDGKAIELVLRKLGKKAAG